MSELTDALDRRGRAAGRFQAELERRQAAASAASLAFRQADEAASAVFCRIAAIDVELKVLVDVAAGRLLNGHSLDISQLERLDGMRRALSLERLVRIRAKERAELALQVASSDLDAARQSHLALLQSFGGGGRMIR